MRTKKNVTNFLSTVWATKFLEHWPIYDLHKIPLTQANFLLAQLKVYLHWSAGEFLSFPDSSIYLNCTHSKGEVCNVRYSCIHYLIMA